jgi:hypothetical protein
MTFRRHSKVNKLKAITALAKKIHKKHPNKKWATCQREAAAKLK